ncbi:metallophosphoesterase [Pseudodesulfovibrio sp.]|uniref:metallophosphoesterase n=1 Tax=unclassified Pseudodesulfovibrio TaxID=2661612 RepID=UPI003AFF8FD0
MIEDGKIVFISDIHMGSHQALFPESPWHAWGWLGEERAAQLGSFLTGLAEDSRLRTVVVLGDLFDDWVAPSHMHPVEGNPSPDALLRSIAEAEQNQPIRQGFSALAAKGVELRYVRGNHDMFLSEDILHAWVPEFICEQDTAGPGTGAHVIDGLLRAEHGCAYCLANAPYVEDGEYRYPVGYYLARIDAYNRAVNDKSADYLKIFSKFCDSPPNKDTCVGKALLAEAADAKLPNGSPFIMNSDYPNSYTVQSVADRFMDWLTQWGHRDYPVNAARAALGDVTGLRESMHDLWLKSEKVRIAVCGHTHRAEFFGYPHRSGNQDPDRPCNAIYVNTGAWVDGVNSTYVEVDISAAANRADVRCIRVRKGRGPSVLGHGFVHLSRSSIPLVG